MNDRLIVPLWAFGLFIVIMNTTMFNVSIPGIIGQLEVTAELGSWIISSYSIGYALTTVIYSRLSDSVSIRLLIAIGVTILMAGSVCGIFATDFNTLLLARILQSGGAGAIAGLGMVIVSRYIPYERRGSALALISAASAMAFGMGPIVGGIVYQTFGLAGLFAITCLVILIFPIIIPLLPKEKPRSFQFDVIGGVLTVVNTITLLLAVTQRSLWMLLICLGSIVIHGFYLRRKKPTFIRKELLKQPAYVKLLVVGFCVMSLNLGNLFLMPLVLANEFQTTAMGIGFIIAPGAILTAVISRYVGRGIDSLGNGRFLLWGHVLLAGVAAVFAVFTSVSPLVILIGYLFFSPAFSATLSALNNEVSRILPDEYIGSGMGMMQLAQFMGGSLSVAICGILISFHVNVSVIHEYGFVYLCLLVLIMCSMAVYLWFQHSLKREASSL
ncbi:MFS transporter [Alkalicoccobacillus plakortidis]|uniref:MFS transporter n=1 Tax=Alkalicoccobacillus plakortidis TaxID=444060 RepID=A0ABT0XNB0_9BACI|nr:MFS transporter [Alkalicoccobacillus plakortidis]MCM2677205.1 MFS transporter [Alkalicoccobacillus plakortidis]